MAGPDLTVDVQGVAQLVAKLGRVLASETLGPPMQRAVERVQRAMQGYPPIPPGSTYQRTGDLGNSWKTQVTTALTSGTYVGTGVTGKVYENVRSPSGFGYGPFVQGAESQTAANARSHWITDDEALRLEAPAIEQDFKDAIQSALR